MISNHKLNPDKIWHSVKLEEGTKDNSNPKFWWFESKITKSQHQPNITVFFKNRVHKRLMNWKKKRGNFWVFFSKVVGIKK